MLINNLYFTTLLYTRKIRNLGDIVKCHVGIDSELRIAGILLLQLRF